MPPEDSTPPDSTNRLGKETSPYLLQHAHNPVDWYAWGEEAFARARAEDKPVFLSIGYSACHWCHVMAHESFENAGIAAILNAHFVSVKVDREERPDLDDVYMRAVQLMTGGGGWPLSVFLTPDRRPFYGGTYYPPRDSFGRPGFPTILRGVARAWSERRDDLLRHGDELILHVERSDRAEPSDTTLSVELIDRAAADLLKAYDPVYGGFSEAPKFPSAHSIELLLRVWRRTGDAELLRAAEFTLDRMAYGGMYDQLGGGFHRYSVDERWLVPHFEKMLYDNAQLAQVYCLAYQATQKPLYARVARETLNYVLRDMRDAGGAFHAAEDADSEGQEGKYYVWTATEIVDALGDADGALFAAYFGVQAEGNFHSHEDYHRGMNVLHVPLPPDTVADELGLTEETLLARLEELKGRMLRVRKARVRPGRDDKVLTSWNGLMVSALARGFQAFGDVPYRDAAEAAASFALTTMRRDGVLLRSHRAGESKLTGYLDDYAFLLGGLVDLYEATFDVQWLDRADEIAQGLLERFHDGENGGFYFTSDEHTDVPVRMKPLFDGSEPSGNSMAATGLLRFARLTGQTAYVEAAEGILRLAAGQMATTPRGFLNMLCALDQLIHAPKEIALAGRPDQPEFAALLSAVHGRFLPNRVIAAFDPARPGGDGIAERVPLLAGKTLRDGAPAAYVCRNYACEEPVTEASALAALLDAEYE